MLAVGKKYLIIVDFYKLLAHHLRSLFRRAPLEEMLQRAGVGPNNRGPAVPEGPPLSAPPNLTDKQGYGFTPLH